MYAVSPEGNGFRLEQVFKLYFRFLIQVKGEAAQVIVRTEKIKIRPRKYF